MNTRVLGSNQLEKSKPTPNPSPAYADRKRWAWLASVVIPLTSAAGPIAFMLGATSNLWFFLPIVIIYGVIPLLDALVSEDLSNPPEAAVQALENDNYYRYVVYASIPVLWASLIGSCIFLATHDLPWWAWLACVIGVGTILGYSLNVSHELGHKRDGLPRKVALFNLALGGYGHFCIEHNRGHHRHVSTPEDPASAKMGESIYLFMLREIPGAWIRAWALETDRLKRNGLSIWHWQNEILQAGLVTLLIYGSMVAVWGLPMLVVLIPVACWGAFQLTSANYVEHYGLKRLQDAHGRYESCKPHHSWNSNHVVSNVILFHLQRHSDHHANPGRSYQSLRDFPNVPRLPSGYLGMFALAYLPPVWYWVMNPRVLQAVNRNVNRINFLPSKREKLIKQYSL